MVVTNHSFLKYLQKMNDTNDLLACWALKLQNHNFIIVHRAGTIRQNADDLLRPPIAFLRPEDDQLYELICRLDL